MALATRMAFGKELIEIAKENGDFIICHPDTQACGLENFGQMFPGREFHFGIAEQNLVGAAAGLASCGNNVFVVSFGVFVSMRACEQVRTFICYPNLNVTIIGTHAGLQVGSDGATHMATEDISIMRSFPNMTIIEPSDAISARAAAHASVDFRGPLYVRLHRNPVDDIHNPDTYRFEIGKANMIFDSGDDVTLIVSGILLKEALEAANILSGSGIRAKVIEMHTIKPIDKQAILKAAKSTNAIVTVEDHTIIGGLGSAVAEVISERCPVILKRIGVKDAFGESGDPKSLFIKHGMSTDHIIEAAKEVILYKTLNNKEI
ncbi:MAG: transketolase family protein [Flavisolibacter sp.]